MPSQQSVQYSKCYKEEALVQGSGSDNSLVIFFYWQTERKNGELNIHSIFPCDHSIFPLIIICILIPFLTPFPTFVSCLSKHCPLVYQHYTKLCTQRTPSFQELKSTEGRHVRHTGSCIQWFLYQEPISIIRNIILILKLNLSKLSINQNNLLLVISFVKHCFKMKHAFMPISNLKKLNSWGKVLNNFLYQFYSHSLNANINMIQIYSETCSNQIFTQET